MNTRFTQEVAEVLIKQNANQATCVVVENLQKTSSNRVTNCIVEYIKPSQNTGLLTGLIVEYIQPMPVGGTAILGIESSVSIVPKVIYAASAFLQSSSIFAHNPGTGTTHQGNAFLVSSTSVSSGPLCLVKGSAVLSSSSSAVINALCWVNGLAVLDTKVSVSFVGTVPLRGNSHINVISGILANSGLILDAHLNLLISSNVYANLSLWRDLHVCTGCGGGYGICCKCRDGSKGRTTSKITLNDRARKAHLAAVEVCRLKQLEDIYWNRLFKDEEEDF
jgi:hypothetical protein